MHGSDSPSKNGESPCQGPHVTPARTRAMAARARSLAGSIPRSLRKSSVYRFDHQSGVLMPSPQCPSGCCCASNRGPQPSNATRERSAAMTAAGVSVRSRKTCQRIDGSASSSHSTTGARDDWSTTGCISHHHDTPGEVALLQQLEAELHTLGKEPLAAADENGA